MKVIVVESTKKMKEEQHALPDNEALGPKQVLIRVKAASVNPYDMKLQSGNFGSWEGKGLGHDVAGVVEKIGPQVTRVKVGDEVWAFIEGPGKFVTNLAYSEYVSAHENLVGKKPKALNWTQASATVLVGLTAYEIAKKVPLTNQSSILVTGASGGVGSLLLPLLAKLGNINNVVVTAGTDASQKYLETVFKISPSKILRYQGKSVQQLVKEAQELNGGKGFDVTFDLVGGDMKRLAVYSVGFNGNVVTIIEEPPNSKWDQDAADMFNGEKSMMFGRCASLHFEFLGMRAIKGTEKDIAMLGVELDQLAQWSDEKVLDPVQVSVIPFTPDAIQQAHDRMKEGHTQGKIVIEM